MSYHVSWKQGGWLKRVVYEADVFANVITGGKVGETMSSRVGRSLLDPGSLGSRIPWPAPLRRHFETNIDLPPPPA